MSIPHRPLSRAKLMATQVLPCDGIPRYVVKGSILGIKLPYSSAYAETFALSGGRKEPGFAADSKPTWVFTPEAMRRIAKLNQLHLPHAQAWREAQRAAAELTPREIDKPVEPATPEPCPTPTEHSS